MKPKCVRCIWRNRLNGDYGYCQYWGDGCLPINIGVFTTVKAAIELIKEQYPHLDWFTNALSPYSIAENLDLDDMGQWKDA